MTNDDAPAPENEEAPQRVPYHIYPVDEAHVIDGSAVCWCKPRLEENGWLIIHHRQVA